MKNNICSFLIHGFLSGLICLSAFACSPENQADVPNDTDEGAVALRIEKLSLDWQGLTDKNAPSPFDDLAQGKNSLWLSVQTQISKFYFRLLLASDSTARLEGKLYELSEEPIDADSAVKFSGKGTPVNVKLSKEQVRKVLLLLSTDSCCQLPSIVADTVFLDKLLSRKMESGTATDCYSMSATGTFEKKQISYSCCTNFSSAESHQKGNSIYILDQTGPKEYKRYSTSNPSDSSDIYKMCRLLLDFSGLMGLE